MGVALNSIRCSFDATGACSDAHLDEQLNLVGAQVVGFVIAQRKEVSCAERRETAQLIPRQ
jgi:hypothetical protein